MSFAYDPSSFGPEPRPLPRLTGGSAVLLSMYLRQIAPAYATVFGCDWRWHLDAPAEYCPTWLDFNPPTDRRAVRAAVRQVLDARPDFWLWRRDIIREALATRRARLLCKI